MPDNTDDNSSSIMINSVTDCIKSSSVWNKLVKTIQNFNIDMEKLIKDSIEYGLDVGLFQECNDGKIMPLDTLNALSSINSDKTLLSNEKTAKNVSGSNIKLIQFSNSEHGLSSSSTLDLSNTIQTRQSTANKNLKRPLKSSLTIRKNKRSKFDSKDVQQIFKNRSDQQIKSFKTRPINRDMVRAVPICAYCLGDELLNRRTKVQENMIVCWDCGTCAHPNCLRWPKSLLEKVRTIRWQCLQCKCCSYCGNVSRKDDDMLLCDSCDQGFHMYCFNPPIKSPPKGEWICRICRPLPHHKETPSFFSNDDFNFFPDCQIVTSENVQLLCSVRKKLLKTSSAIKRNKIDKFILQSKSEPRKRQLKLNLLHMKTKKLLDKAVQRQKLALTDGLSMFFTPGNKRQSRVSKQSLSSESFSEPSGQISEISSFKEGSFLRSRIKSTKSEEKGRLRKHRIGLRTQRKDDSCPDKSYATQGTETQSSQLKYVHKKSPNIVVQKHSKRLCLKFTKTFLKKSLRKSKKLVKNGRKRERTVVINATDSDTSAIQRRLEPFVDQSSVLCSAHTDPDPNSISDMDRQWYSDIQTKVTELLPPPFDAPPQLHSLNKSSRYKTEHSEPPELSIESSNTKDSVLDLFDPLGDAVSNPNLKFPPRIQIGKYVIDTWYSAPYPSEYARLSVLYICEYCLKHMKSYDVYVMHTEKCIQHLPPGDEIYRNGDLSIFEVDGYVSKLYCQQLCLLAKLFLDHKTLYYDVEPFLFYVAVMSKNQSCHIIGYFSKEKRSTHKYNLSCIMVLPPYQKFNYGRFLIDFSYLLSRKEGVCGSPEKPLSTLGRLSYESYWKSKVIPFLLNKDTVTEEFYRNIRFSKPPKGLSITIDRITAETGINPHDVASTIQMLSKTVDLDDSERITIQLNWDKIKTESEKYASKFPDWIPLRADCLRWTPLTMQSNNKVSTSIQESPTITAPIKQSNSPTKIDEVKPEKGGKPLKTPKSSPKSLHQNIDRKLIVRPTSQSGSSDCSSQNTKLDVRSKDTKKRFLSPSTLKSSPKCKRECKERTIVTRNMKSSDEFQMVTRNRGSSQQLTVSSFTNRISPIKVDLTSSDNSDNQECDDCVTVASPQSEREKNWKKKRPVLEISSGTFVASSVTSGASDACRSRPSPSIATNERSPVSTSHNPIIVSTLVSPEIDLEEETEADLILSGGRRPLIILEKCDPIMAKDPIVVVAFVAPSTCAKDGRSATSVLSRAPSQDSNSGHQDDSSNSLQLPSDISHNEEFKRFFNDGNVFNSITTSQTTTDSSDKDADDSLLSVSNSDVEITGAYSCDSSLCCTRTATKSTSVGEESRTQQEHCSPCQSDLVRSQVTSTTQFTAPCGTVGPIPQVHETDVATRRRRTCSRAVEGRVVSGVAMVEEDEGGGDGGEMEDGGEGSMNDGGKGVVVSSSLGECSVGDCVEEEEEVTSMATRRRTMMDSASV